MSESCWKISEARNRHSVEYYECFDWNNYYKKKKKTWFISFVQFGIDFKVMCFWCILCNIFFGKFLELRIQNLGKLPYDAQLIYIRCVYVYLSESLLASDIFELISLLCYNNSKVCLPCFFSSLLMLLFNRV